MIQSIAVCAGSGASVLRNVKCDLVLTGEMSHHEVLDLVHKNVSVILTDHSNSERGFLSKWLLPKLEDHLGRRISLIVSKRDADPLEVV